MSEPGGGEFNQPPPSEKAKHNNKPASVGFNPWSTLGFTTPEAVTTATGDDIKKAYRKFVRENHPDIKLNDPDAEEKLKEGSWAYEILTDPKKKETYEKGE